MTLQDVLKKSDPSKFNAKKQRIIVGDSTIKIEDFGEEMNFHEMISNRREISPSLMYNQLHSKEGFIAANIGVSAAINVEFEGSKKNYLLNTVWKIRQRGEGEDDKNYLVKLISGFHPFGQSFEKTILDEVKEELLVVDEKERIQEGHFDALGLKSRLPEPAKNIKGERSDSFSYSVTSGGSLNCMYSLNERKIEGLSQEAKMTFHPFVSSGQMLFPLKLTMPKKGSLYHLEDTFVPENKEKNIKERLDLKLNRKGILLFEKDGERLSGNTFYLSNGVLVPGPTPDKISLYSSFIPKDSLELVGINEMSFEDYLKIR